MSLTLFITGTGWGLFYTSRLVVIFSHCHFTLHGRRRRQRSLSWWKSNPGWIHASEVTKLKCVPCVICRTSWPLTQEVWACILLELGFMYGGRNTQKTEWLPCNEKVTGLTPGSLRHYDKLNLVAPDVNVLAVCECECWKTEWGDVVKNFDHR